MFPFLCQNMYDHFKIRAKYSGSKNLSNFDLTNSISKFKSTGCVAQSKGRQTMRVLGMSACPPAAAFSIYPPVKVPYIKKIDNFR